MNIAALSGDTVVPSDKSIAHRAFLLSSIASGESRVITSALGRDNLATVRIMRQLGVEIRGTLCQEVLRIAEDEGLSGFSLSEDSTCSFLIQGKGFSGLRKPSRELDCGNSGTTARLLTGLLAGCPFDVELTGDDSLRRRPFQRVTEPLSQMGASFSGTTLPLRIAGSTLSGLRFVSPRASAQVKSAILLAGLQTRQRVVVEEPTQSRNHTELMLQSMGCPIEAGENDDGRWMVTLPSRGVETELLPIDSTVPGDFSAAAFLIVATSLVGGSCVKIHNVGFNPSRIGLYHILERMGASIEVRNRRVVAGEQTVDLTVRTAERLSGLDLSSSDVVLAIDEIPILAVAAALANGVTRIRGAAELRVKESDRLAMTRALLESFSCQVEEHDDGLSIQGNPQLSELFSRGSVSLPGEDASWRSSGDHRISMSGSVLEYALSGNFSLSEPKVVETSFPGFIECFKDIGAI